MFVLDFLLVFSNVCLSCFEGDVHLQNVLDHLRYVSYVSKMIFTFKKCFTSSQPTSNYKLDRICTSHLKNNRVTDA